jgi:hypothetical protein
MDRDHWNLRASGERDGYVDPVTKAFYLVALPNCLFPVPFWDVAAAL